MDVRELEPTEVLYHDEKGRKYLTYRFPNGILMYHNHPRMGNMQVVFNPEETKPAKPVPTYKGQGGIIGDFLECCKKREKPFRDIELATHTMAVCHLGSIAYALKRNLKWDQARQEFPGDAEANRMVDRARRQPWIL